MASVTVTISDDQAARITAAVCGRDSYVPATTEDAIAYVQEKVFEWLRAVTLEHEARQASQAVYENQNDPLVSAIVTQGG